MSVFDSSRSPNSGFTGSPDCEFWPCSCCEHARHWLYAGSSGDLIGPPLRGFWAALSSAEITANQKAGRLAQVQSPALSALIVPGLPQRAGRTEVPVLGSLMATHFADGRPGHPEEPYMAYVGGSFTASAALLIQ